MQNTVSLKRKNIDLPLDTLAKLTVLALAEGKSLKAYIEWLLIRRAESVQFTIAEHPSPTRDQWWDDPANIDEVRQGLEEFKQGKGKEYSLDELKDLMNL